MEIQCPSCGTRFRVDPSRLEPDGTQVRCSVCDYRFLAYPGEAGTEAEVPTPAFPGEGPGMEGTGGARPGKEDEPRKSRKTREAQVASPRQGRFRRAGAWVLRMLLLLLLLGLLAELAFAFRSQWLAVPWVRAVVERGLELADVDWRLPVSLRHYRVEAVNAQLLTLSSGRRITLVQGVLVNDASFGQQAPDMELRATGPGGEIRYREVMSPGRRFSVNGEMELGDLRGRWEKARAGFPDRLNPGEEVPFTIVLDDVPPGVRRFQVEIVG